jgi:hypothetical protein
MPLGKAIYLAGVLADGWEVEPPDLVQQLLERAGSHKLEQNLQRDDIALWTQRCRLDTWALGNVTNIS